MALYGSNRMERLFDLTNVLCCTIRPAKLRSFEIRKVFAKQRTPGFIQFVDENSRYRLESR